MKYTRWLGSALLLFILFIFTGEMKALTLTENARPKVLQVQLVNRQFTPPALYQTQGSSIVYQETVTVSVSCKYPRDYNEVITKEVCQRGCVEMYEYCLGNTLNCSRECRCTLFYETCKKDPGLFIQGCPVFSENLFENCD